MLQKLAYFNLFMAMIYLLAYLKSGTFSSTSGIFVVIVFNWLSIMSYERERYRWKIWHYVMGIWSVYFVGTIIYGTVNIWSAVIEFAFASNDTLTFLALSTVFSATVLLHFVLYFMMNYKQEPQ